MVSAKRLASSIRSERKRIWLKEPSYVMPLREKLFTSVMFVRGSFDMAAAVLFQIRALVNDIPLEHLRIVAANFTEAFGKRCNFFGFKSASNFYLQASTLFREIGDKRDFTSVVDELWIYSSKLYDWIDSMPQWDKIDKIPMR